MEGRSLEGCFPFTYLFEVANFKQRGFYQFAQLRVTRISFLICLKT